MKCQREKFQLQRKYAYLNCAYMSPLLKKVENAGIKGIKKKRKPFQISGEDFFNETEKDLKDFDILLLNYVIHIAIFFWFLKLTSPMLVAQNKNLNGLHSGLYSQVYNTISR